MVITERTLAQIGPAVAASKSLLIYGKPGDGKTFLIESLNNLEGSPVYLPHAIECQGNIIQVYDRSTTTPSRKKKSHPCSPSRWNADMTAGGSSASGPSS